MEVFLLWHVHELEGGDDDEKLIGVYSTHEKAEQARLRALARPGFCDSPEGFQICRYPVDEDRNWKDGFITV